MAVYNLRTLVERSQRPSVFDDALRKDPYRYGDEVLLETDAKGARFLRGGCEYLMLSEVMQRGVALRIEHVYRIFGTSPEGKLRARPVTDGDEINDVAVGWAAAANRAFATARQAINAATE